MTVLRRLQGTASQQPGVRRMDVVDAMVWLFRDQKVHKIEGGGRGLLPAERAADGMQVFERSMTDIVGQIAVLGTQIDQLGYDTGQVAPAAEALWDIVRRMPNHWRTLLIRYGERADIPSGHSADWRMGPQWKTGPRYDENGLPHPKAVERIYDEHRNVIGHKLAADHTPYLIEALQHEYLDWREALLGVCQVARVSVTLIVVTGPKLPLPEWARDDARGQALLMAY